MQAHILSAFIDKGRLSEPAWMLDRLNEDRGFRRSGLELTSTVALYGSANKDVNGGGWLAGRLLVYCEAELEQRSALDHRLSPCAFTAEGCQAAKGGRIRVLSRICINGCRTQNKQV
jgi:hypothetical protein